MAYLVNKTDGELLTTILDGQTNNTSSSLVLIGKQVTGYGELSNENLIHLLENFANAIDPVHPLAGQLWWNTVTNAMQVFDGTTWRPSSGFTSAAAQPSSSYVGDQWWDQVNDQYKVYSGTEWVVVGPAYSKLDSKTGALVENVYDTSLGKHTVIKVYHNGNVTAILSRDAQFTPNVAIGGFTTVHPGISFTSAVDAIKLYGTATNSDTLGNIAPGQFLRSDVDATTTASLTVNGHLTVGQNSEFAVIVNGASQVTLENTANNQDINIKVTVATVLRSAIVVDGATGLVRVAADPVDALGVTTKQYTDALVSAARVDTTNQIAANVATLNNDIATTQYNLGVANTNINNIRIFKANTASPIFSGVVIAPTPAVGDHSSRVATTAFVATAISDFDTTRIYNYSSAVKVNLDTIDLVAFGTYAATVTSTGITTITQPQNDSSTLVATTAYSDRGDKNFVRNSTKYQPTCYVSDQLPDNGVGADGDFWFQYQ